MGNSLPPLEGEEVGEGGFNYATFARGWYQVEPQWAHCPGKGARTVARRCGAPEDARFPGGCSYRQRSGRPPFGLAGLARASDCPCFPRSVELLPAQC